MGFYVLHVLNKEADTSFLHSILQT